MTLFPAFEDLTNQQREFCRQKAADQTVTSGPPGTGKTVVAFHRARQILGDTFNAKVVVIMHSNVLTSYAQDWKRKVEKTVVKAEGRFEIKTWHQWLWGWLINDYKKGGDRRSIPGTRLYLSQSELKRVKREYGCGKHEFPWEDILKRVGERQEELEREKEQPRRAERFKPKKPIRPWEHVIIDEGQDFPPEFYKLVGRLRRLRSTQEDLYYSITVSADENQIITRDNSTIKEMCTRLKCKEDPDGDSHHELTKNFRNTLQIAKIARVFFTGSPTGIPDLPEIRVDGDVPQIHLFPNPKSSTSYLIKTIQSAPTARIGVIMRHREDVLAIKDEAASELDGRLVQHFVSADYSTGDESQSRELAMSLNFVKPGTVTFLCDKSCKGLEFEVVIIMNLQHWGPDNDEEEFKRSMYVMTSRGRDVLHIHALSTGIDDDPASVRALPGWDDQGGSNELKWIRHG